MKDTDLHDIKVPNFLSELPVSDGTVTLRAMSMKDADAYAVGTEDALVKRFAHLPISKYTPEIVIDLIGGIFAEGLRDGNLAVLTIADSSSDVFLGSMVFFDVSSKAAEIGYWISPEHRGQKVSRRALSLALNIGRALGMRSIRARTVEGNPASQNVLLDAGFTQKGEARPEVVPSGRTEVSLNYSIEL
jgi:RimJ/RimL family protein N-acetyltransferase